MEPNIEKIITDSKTKADRVRKRVLLITLIPVAALLLVLFYISGKISTAQDKLNGLEASAIDLDSVIAAKQAKLDTLTVFYNNLKYTALYSFGWPIDSIDKTNLESRHVMEAMEANNEIRQLLAKRVKYDNILVKHMAKDVDKEKISAVLRDFGFVYKEFPSSAVMRGKATNTIFYGDGITTEQLQLLGYILVRAGIDLKLVQHGQALAGQVKIVAVAPPVKGSLTVDQLRKGIFNNGDSVDLSRVVIR